MRKELRPFDFGGREIKDPVISVCRDSKTIALFDGFEMIRGFMDYTDETIAINVSEHLFRSRTNKTPRVVFPRITSIKKSYK